MKVVLDLKKVKGKFKYRGPIRIRLKLADALALTTELSHYNDGYYPLLQKHVVTLAQQAQPYIELSILAQNGAVLAQITVFLNKFKELNTIQIKNQSETYVVEYSLTEIDDSPSTQTTKRRTSKMEQEPQNMRQESGKLQILRLGVLMFNFAQRLDPLVYLYNSTLSIATWKQPVHTFACGVFLTVAIYYIKAAILLGGLGLFFSKDWIYSKISKVHRYRNNHRRVIVPQENAYFLQEGMDQYCALYEYASAFLFNQDKAMLVNVINLVCKTCLLFTLLLFLFEVEVIAIMALWSTLILTSPYSKSITSLLKPAFSYLIGEYDKIFSKVTNLLGNAIKKDEAQVTKQFYYYQYERWWVVKGWCDQTKKYSDEKYQAIAFRREKAPQGWGWIQEWNIDFSGGVDSEGYQYSNDLSSQFKASSSMPTRRRRKWKRSCIRLRQALVD